MLTKQYKQTAEEDYQQNGFVLSRLYFTVAGNRRNASMQILAIVVVVALLCTAAFRGSFQLQLAAGQILWSGETKYISEWSRVKSGEDKTREENY